MVTTLNFQGVDGAAKTLKLDLDPARSNEKTILNFLNGGNFYEPDVAKICVRVLRAGDTVVDVGANVGFFSILAASLVGPTGRVVSFEPDPANRERLANNADVNGFKHVTMIEAPAVDKPGPVQFFINSDDSGGNALWDPAQFPGNVRSQAEKKVMAVSGTTIDAEVARLGLAIPKVLKVDTEGADQRVLEGARKLLQKAAVPFVITELHEFGLQRMGCSQQSFRSYMEGLGYSTFVIGYSGSLPRLAPPKTRISGGQFIINVLFSTIDAVGQYWPDVVNDPTKT